MSKYSSGYSLMQMLPVLGWIVIAISLIGGISIGSNAPRGMGGIGFLVAIIGGFQGFMLLVLWAIGTAILDGSIAQQDLLSRQGNPAGNTTARPGDAKVEELLRLMLANALGKPGLAFHEQCGGVPIFRTDAGTFVVNENSFDRIEAARDSLRAAVAPGSDSAAEDAENFAVIGRYKIPRVRGKYLLNGMEFDSLVKLDKEIGRIIASGGSRQLEKYLVG